MCGVISNQIKPHMIRNIRFTRLIHIVFCLGWLFSGKAFAQQSTPELILSTSRFKCKSISVTANNTLNSQIPEGSGLTAWNHLVWTHNDSGKLRIFALDTLDGKIVKTFDLPGVKNIDWEDMDQDKNFLYLGDIGNNMGAREQLRIYKISKQALSENRVVIDSIVFQWPDTFESGKSRKINFDCEAMAVVGDSVFLFTKEWKNRRCSRIFNIPSKAGNYTATYVSTIRTRILVTGACYAEKQKKIVLCGYSLLLTPKLLVLPMPYGNLKDIGKGTQIRLRKRLRQTEGVGTFNGRDFYIISEETNLFLWKNKPKLFKVTIDQ